MNLVPVITETHTCKLAELGLPYTFAGLAEICNKAIEIALAEQATQDRFISADEAKALGAGNAEYSLDHMNDWRTCSATCQYMEDNCYGVKFLYRAIRKKVPAEPKYERVAVGQRTFADGRQNETIYETRLVKPEPAEPTCQVKNLDTNKLKTMTRESAKLLQAETNGVCDWFSPNGNVSNDYIFDYSAVGIYTYKLKQKKQVSWKDVPVGAAVSRKTEDDFFVFMGVDYSRLDMARLFSATSNTIGLQLTHLKLAPADQQPWIAVQDEKDYGINKVDGLIYFWRSNHSFKIIGIADGWELV